MSLTREQRRAAERAASKNQHHETSRPFDAAGLSQARLEANRANAQLSSGPKTESGKAISSQNSFKHGLYSSRLVIPSEDPAQLDALKATLFAEHRPANETEALLVQEMAEHYWLMKRYRRLETMFLSLDRPQPSEAEAAQRMHGRAERSFYKAFKTLREIQKERKLQELTASQKVPTVSTGFVPTKKASAANGFVPPEECTAISDGFVPSNLRKPDSVA